MPHTKLPLTVTLAAAAATALAMPAIASAESFSVTFTNVGSAAGFGDAGNDISSFTYSSADGPDFLIGDIDVVGTVTNQGDPLATPSFDGNFLSDALIDISRTDLDPNSDFAVVEGSNQGQVAIDTFANLGQSSGALQGLSAYGDYEFQYFEFFDFDEVAGFDNVFDTITITINEFVAAEPPEATMATLDFAGQITTQLDEGEIEWFQFDYDGISPFLFTTFFSDLEPSNDTELALYDANGTLLITNDDASGATFLSSLLIDGELLDAGTYYLAASAFNTVFDDGFDAVSTSTNSGTLVITGLSPVAVPEPSVALAGLAGAGLLLMRRRRR